MTLKFQSSTGFDFLEKLKFLDFLKKLEIMLLLYEFSRGNQVDGSPRVANAKYQVN